MATEQFLIKANATKPGVLRALHYNLGLEHPKNFPAWNEKLRGLPTLGFTKNPSLWELHPRKQVQVGFKPREIPKPIQNQKEFLGLALSGDIDEFRARAGNTSSKRLMQWLQGIQKKDPKQFYTALSMLKVKREMGYGRDEFYYPQKVNRRAQTKVGFMGGDLDKNYETFPEFLKSFESDSPNTFAKQFIRTPGSKKLELMRQLKQEKPDLYGSVVEKLRSRVAIGFTSSTPENIVQAVEKSRVQQFVGYFPNIDMSDLDEDAVAFLEKLRKNTDDEFAMKQCSLKNIIGGIVQ